jgi:SAM-dependent methyltransferase
MNEWFARWFGQEYLALYQHRDDRDARQAVSLIRRVVGDVAPGRLLDLACGTGRHARALRDWGETVGIDLSGVLLEVAARAGGNVPYVRGDMRRLPFAERAFGVVVNLFTSFGYFETDAEHETVVREVARVTRPGGVFVLDYLHAKCVRETLVPSDEREVNGQVLRMRRYITSDGRYVLKTVSVPGSEHTYVERVRLFTPDELRQLLERNGFTVTQEFGDYAGGARTASSSRVILFAERA